MKTNDIYNIKRIIDGIFKDAKEKNFYGYDPYDIKEKKIYRFLPMRVIIDIAENFQTKVISQVLDNIVFKISADPDHIRECLDALKVFGKHEIVRSGPTAIYL